MAPKRSHSRPSSPNSANVSLPQKRLGTYSTPHHAYPGSGIHHYNVFRLKAPSTHPDRTQKGSRRKRRRMDDSSASSSTGLSYSQEKNGDPASSSVSAPQNGETVKMDGLVAESETQGGKETDTGAAEFLLKSPDSARPDSQEVSNSQGLAPGAVSELHNSGTYTEGAPLTSNDLKSETEPQLSRPEVSQNVNTESLLSPSKDNQNDKQEGRHRIADQPPVIRKMSISHMISPVEGDPTTAAIPPHEMWFSQDQREPSDPPIALGYPRQVWRDHQDDQYPNSFNSHPISANTYPQSEWEGPSQPLPDRQHRPYSPPAHFGNPAPQHDSTSYYHSYRGPIDFALTNQERQFYPSPHPDYPLDPISQPLPARRKRGQLSREIGNGPEGSVQRWRRSYGYCRSREQQQHQLEYNSSSPFPTPPSPRAKTIHPVSPIPQQADNIQSSSNRRLGDDPLIPRDFEFGYSPNSIYDPRSDTCVSIPRKPTPLPGTSEEMGRLLEEKQQEIERAWEMISQKTHCEHDLKKANKAWEEYADKQEDEIKNLKQKIKSLEARLYQLERRHMYFH